MTQTTIITTANAQRWQAALARAIDNALDILVCGATGEAFVESASQPGLLHAVSATTCTCPAGQRGIPCMHRAAYLAQCDELLLDPEPKRIQFVCENNDRHAIVVDGETFGHVVANQWGGWEAFAGQFPNARRFPSADGCTLHEVERYLSAQLPRTLHIPATVPAEDLVAVA